VHRVAAVSADKVHDGQKLNAGRGRLSDGKGEVRARLRLELQAADEGTKVRQEGVMARVESLRD